MKHRIIGGAGRRPNRWSLTLGLPVAALALLFGGVAMADDSGETKPEPVVVRGAELSPPVTPFVFEGDVRDLPRPPQWKPGDPIKEIPRRIYPEPGTEPEIDYEPLRDPLLDRQIELEAQRGGGSFTLPTRNFAGQGYTGVNPPDTAGDVGPNHYVQMVNAGGGAVVRIFDKNEPTPSELATFSLDSLGSGNCASGFGDPIVIYDRLADRWMLTEFSGSGNNLCFYISQSGDPVSGGWYNYGFTAPSFPDYPKYGVWPTDANGGQGSYVVTANDGGPGIYAFNRGLMISGSPGTYQRLTIPGLPGFSFESPTPADLDGPTPPATGSPAIIMRHRDTENHGGPVAPGDVLEMWSFQVDWLDTGNTTLTQQPDVDTSEFDSDLCGLTSFFCFPQPGTGTTLDPLREVIMNRLQYMNHETHQTLVGNLVTDVDGTNHGGVRWFELRGGDGAWTLHQEGTYAIDDDHRWMAASAMDQSGNIAVAYNISSDTTFPGLRYTGRQADDPLGVMTAPETAIFEGTASNSSNRYGDYASMNLDPVDDCTFWFTGEANASSSWKTQIASFKFDACGCLEEPLPPSASAAIAGDNRVDVDWDDSLLPSVVEYLVRRSRSPGGPYETIHVEPDSSLGVAGGAGYTWADTTVSGDITYYYTVVASDGLACKSDPSNEADVTATGACTLAPVFGGIESVSPSFTGVCSLDLSWSAATPDCAGPVTYNVYRSTDPGFMPEPINLLVAGITNTSISDLNSLDSGTRYYYVVRAVDESNLSEETNEVELSAIPLGELTNGTWIDDAGDTGNASLALASPWTVNATEGNIGPNVYKTGNYGNLTCKAVTTPQLQLGAASQLSFASKHDIESGWDKGEVQISTDGGFSWQRIEVGYPASSSQASDNCGLPTGTYFTGTNLTWQNYGADLSTWSNQVVQIRWLISSDGSQTRDGWWIDDISITDVDVPGACTTGSACEENPFVNVLPQGSFTVCEGSEQTLTADLAGGVPPFSYQWYRDGLPIPGADGPTLEVDDFGIHAYNVKVSSDSCTDEVTDGSPTQIAWGDRPQFVGLADVFNPELGTCTLELSWDPATTPCAGPVSYNVYRDVTSPVSVVPENRIGSGITATSFTDADTLDDGAIYFYVVRAVDESIGTEDGNVVELAGVPTSPQNGPEALFVELFETITPWTVSFGPGAHSCGGWELSSGSTERPSGSSGSYAIAKNQGCGFGGFTSTIVTSPVIDLDVPGFQSASLEVDLFFNAGSGEQATVEVWDGGAWQTVWTGSGDFNGHQSLDVSAAAMGNSGFQVRFSYQNAASDFWFSVDNVIVVVDAVIPCATDVAPVPAPDGRLATQPLRGARTTVPGDELQVTWDVASCAATDYNLLYGDLADVSGLALDGSSCGLGTSGTYDWSGVPSGDLFFLVVGTDGSGVESSWGTDSISFERNGVIPSGECGVAVKRISAICP